MVKVFLGLILVLALLSLKYLLAPYANNTTSDLEPMVMVQEASYREMIAQYWGQLCPVSIKLNGA